MFKHRKFVAYITTYMQKKKKNWLRPVLIIGFILLLAGAGAVWYIFTEKFADIADENATYTVNASDLIKEFIANDTLANKKYAEQTMVVTGIVSETEAADTTINIKFTDTTTGSYAIFAFQQQHLAEAKTVKVGDNISIKGSCSGGAFSKILEAEFITFKRCAIKN